MMKYINPSIKYLNEHLCDNNDNICRWLTSYIHSSYRYCKRNPDRSLLSLQPGFPNVNVIGYRQYYDYSFEKHKKNRIVVLLTDNTEYEMSMYKFKKYVRSHSSYTCKVFNTDKKNDDLVHKIVDRIHSMEGIVKQVMKPDNTITVADKYTALGNINGLLYVLNELGYQYKLTI